MNPHDPQTWTLAAVVFLAIIAALVLIVRERRRMQSRHLEQRFGPEYDRVLRAEGDRSRAEVELKAREARVEQFKLVALAPAEAARFAGEWELLQARFVDHPTGVVAEADRLVRALMHKRGYPVGDFERRAADISVNHPNVVENYRAAQAIVSRELRGEASTEDLRKALVHYRALFEDLLEQHQSGRGRPALSVASGQPKQVV